MNQLTAPVLTMSSRDIAELTGKELMRDEIIFTVF